MRSPWEGKTHLQNTVSLLKFLELLNGNRSFDDENLRSVGQRAAKLPVIKLWEWFDPGRPRTRADRPCTHFGWNGGSGRLFPTLTASNFTALSYRPKIFSIKRSKYFSKCVKFQDAASILNVGFAQSKWPHKVY